MIEYSRLCKKQTEYILKTQKSWLNVAEGGKRSGKNIMNLIAWAICLENHPDKLHLAGGVSISATKLNIIDSNGYGLKYIFNGRCKECQYQGRDALRIQTKTGEKIILVTGGGDKTSVPKIKGNTYGTVYVTEVNECHSDFVKECFTRTLTSHDRKLFFDLNPKAPAHWFYEEILDFYDGALKRGQISGYNYQHFTVADNLSIGTNQLSELLRTYDKTSIWYQRDILGLRTSASGRIYTSYSFETCSVTPAEIDTMRFTQLSVGIDVGGTDATVATLTGLTDDKKIVHIDGMYHKQGIDNRMDEATYANMIVEWLIPWSVKYPKIGTIYVDSANKLFSRAVKNALYKRGLNRFDVRAFDKSDGILQRIELTCMLLVQNRYKICSKMKEWHEAMQMATWVQDEYENGEWVRTDDGSYPIDCLDSAEYSYYGMRKYLGI